MQATKSIVRALLICFHVFHYRRRSLTTKRFKCLTISQNTHSHREHPFNQHRTVSEWPTKNQFKRKFSRGKNISYNSFLVAQLWLDTRISGYVELKCQWKSSHFSLPQSTFPFSFSPQRHLHRELFYIECFVVCFDYFSMNFRHVSEIAQFPCEQLSPNFGADDW